MPADDEFLNILLDIKNSLQRLELDVSRIKRAVLSEAKLEEEELELDKEMEQIGKSFPDSPSSSKTTGYKEETLDEVEKQLGR